MADSFDYIIVGAGSAGCVLANRLSADPSVRVLLLEAGRDDRVRNVAIPAAFSTLFRSELDWDYRTKPVAELAGRELYWPRGKCLGGSSSINAMIYIRGNRADYDSWAQPGWSYDEVLPYFRRCEDNSRGADAYHGVGGPLAVSDPRFRHPLCELFLSAATAAGLPANPDFNGAAQEGVGFYQLTQRRGRRASAAAAFLHPVTQRANLEVRPRTTVSRVLFEGERASGVEVISGGARASLRADREVILAAGAIGSPQLLMLSGVGPADDLRALGLPVLVDNGQVGANLADHLAAGLGWSVSGWRTMESAQTLPNLMRYLLTRGGPFVSNIAEVGAFLPGPAGAPPELQLLAAASFFLDHGFTPAPGPGFSIGAILLTPQSRGRIRLASADPTVKPLIDPGYLSAAEDLTRLRDGLKCALEIAAQPPLRSHLGPLYEIEDTSDAALSAWVRSKAETMYHPTSTAAMGRVVDAQCRVLGVSGLRVADASIMPSVPRGNTNAPTIMLADRASDLITSQALSQTSAASAAS